MKRIALVLAIMAAVSACRDHQGKLFELSGRVFIFNPRLAEAIYVVTLRPLEAASNAKTAIATFEDPAGGRSIRVERKIWPNATKVALESPPVFCIVKDRPYAVKIEIVDESGVALQHIDTTITSTLDQTIMPDRPLVVGPAYDPNPELKGNPAGKIEGEGSHCPSRG
jgi:hypothetical protein